MEQVLEVSPNEASFAGAYESLKEALANDYRVMWIGGDQSLSTEIKSISIIFVIFL